ncbi:MAG TPA: hydrogenase formation protein HypD, partial [bacterium (Candidatus Stahlbacteria)]|nr:hydrogenase formation protein HypD [Candidatus Stahlbacteria bacterium]
HTMAIGRWGLRKLLPGSIDLISGPGCPVCVTPTSVIDACLDLEGVTIAIFGDLLRVPGRKGTLEEARGSGLDVRVVYSPADALKIAGERETVFVGIGFETTSPTIGATIIKAQEIGLKRFSVLPAFKLIPPALDALLSSGETRIDGFILPGHVSTIIGSEPYKFIAKDYLKGGVIAGFEPVDILQAISYLIEQKKREKPAIEIAYRRSVTPDGNLKAKEVIHRVFETTDGLWRGLGWIKESGLRIRDEFREFDASARYSLKQEEVSDDPRCRCGDVLKGLIKPNRCSLFSNTCNPANPIGPCMVSSEGSCAAYYQYER